MARHYIDPSDRVREAVAKLPIPDSFRWETGQLDLFDDEKREERERKRRTEKPASDWRFGQSHAVFRGHAVELRPANNAKQWNGTGRKRNVRLTLLQTLVEAAGPVSYQTLREKVWDGKPVKLSTIKETVYQLNRILRRNFNWPKSACPISTARIGQSWTGLMFELPAGAPLPAWK